MEAIWTLWWIIQSDLEIWLILFLEKYFINWSIYVSLEAYTMKSMIAWRHNDLFAFFKIFMLANFALFIVLLGSWFIIT